MKTDIVVPASGESVTEGDIARWFKESGDFVKMDEPLLELETDKASLEIAAETDGILTITAEEGTTVQVGAAIGHITPGEAADAAPEPPAETPTAGPEETEAAEETSTPKVDDEFTFDKAQVSTVANLEMPSPAARKLMAEHRLSAAEITGTGKGGRITKADVLRRLDALETQERDLVAADATRNPYEADAPVVSPDETIILYPGQRERASDLEGWLPSEASRQEAPPAVPKLPPAAKSGPPPPAAEKAAAPAADAAEPPAPTPPTPGSRATRRERMSRLRKTIASRLVEAQQTAALLTTFNEVDMSAIMAIRSQHKASFSDQHEIGLGFMSFFTTACCQALQAFPVVNAQVGDDEIIYHDYCDIGIAVSTPRGLVVPVIRNAESLGFADIERTIRELALRGRDSKLTPEDLSGGTFTITNGGVFGSMLSTPIVNRPQSAILGMHNIVQRPMAVDGEVVIRPVMYIALTYDHRIIDGAEAVQFLVKVKDACEDPTRMLLKI
jgi:2-oxoglutarate dehydrogenase E2 component (dihydrolipoamide succinyltransferase)